MKFLRLYNDIFSLKTQRQVFWALCGIIMLMGSLYIYFLSVSVMNVVMIQEKEHDITQLSDEVGELELAYLEKKEGISAPLVEELGFHKITHKSYVTRTSIADRVTLQYDE